MHENDLAIRKEIEIQNMSKNRLFERSELWITRTFYSQKDIIAYREPEQGIIVANGTIDYPAAGELEAISKVQYTISFVMREEIRGAHIILTFDNLMLNVPKNYHRSRFWSGIEYVGGYSVPIKQQIDFEAAQRGVFALAAKLEEYLRKK